MKFNFLPSLSFLFPIWSLNPPPSGFYDVIPSVSQLVSNFPCPLSAFPAYLRLTPQRPLSWRSCKGRVLSLYSFNFLQHPPLPRHRFGRRRPHVNMHYFSLETLSFPLPPCDCLFPGSPAGRDHLNTASGLLFCSTYVNRWALVDLSSLAWLAWVGSENSLLL